MSELVNKEITSELDLIVKFEGGKAIIEIKYGGSGGSASVVGTVEAEYFVKKIADAIPGQIDDMILNGLLAAVK
jgi:hypothetical protein